MTLADLAERLAAARSESRLAKLKPADAITSVEDAYGVQAELVKRANNDVRGWKVTALASADQKNIPLRVRSQAPCLDPMFTAHRQRCCYRRWSRRCLKAK